MKDAKRKILWKRRGHFDFAGRKRPLLLFNMQRHFQSSSMKDPNNFFPWHNLRPTIDERGQKCLVSISSFFPLYKRKTLQRKKALSCRLQNFLPRRKNLFQDDNVWEKRSDDDRSGKNRQQNYEGGSREGESQKKSEEKASSSLLRPPFSSKSEPFNTSVCSCRHLCKLPSVAP